MHNMPCSVTDDGREFEPPTTEREPACDDDTRRCIVCQKLCAESDTCSPECESEYREGIRERARDAARESFEAGLHGVASAICKGVGL